LARVFPHFMLSKVNLQLCRVIIYLTLLLTRGTVNATLPCREAQISEKYSGKSNLEEVSSGCPGRVGRVTKAAIQYQIMPRVE
jgi:hypothetical protein